MHPDLQRRQIHFRFRSGDGFRSEAEVRSIASVARQRFVLVRLKCCASESSDDSACFSVRAAFSASDRG